MVTVSLPRRCSQKLPYRLLDTVAAALDADCLPLEALHGKVA